MKFLLESMWCCGIQPITLGDHDEPPPMEETWALMTTASQRSRSRRRSDTAGKSGDHASPAEWKPSLSAISENRVAAAVDNSQIESERIAKMKKKKRGGGFQRKLRFRDRIDSRDFGQPGFPAFSPVPIMF